MSAYSCTRYLTDDSPLRISGMGGLRMVNRFYTKVFMKTKKLKN